MFFVLILKETLVKIKSDFKQFIGLTWVGNFEYSREANYLGVTLNDSTGISKGWQKKPKSLSGLDLLEHDVKDLGN